jgi:hypothetical protein
MATASQFRHEDVSAVPRGYKVRTVTHPSGHRVRIAYPPGPRRTGAGKLVSILHPKGENARCGFDGKSAVGSRRSAANSREERTAIIQEYKRRGMDALGSKDGGFAIRDRGFVSLRQARKETGIDMHGKRESREALPWGDYATVAMMSKSRRRANPKSKIQNPKSRTREQVEKMQKKAVRFLRDVVGDSDKADEIEGLSLPEYAERKKITLTNPEERLGKAKLIKVRRPFRKSERAWEYQGRRIVIGGHGPMPRGAVELEPGVYLDIGSGEVYRQNPQPKQRKNQAQTEAAAALYELFHGRKPKEIIELHQDVIRREDYAALGQLIEITLPDLNLVIDFEGDKVLLAASPNGKQMYVIGGNQDIHALLGKLADDEKDFLDLGEVGAVVYRTRKDFDKFEEIDYKHKMGEGGHEKPRLMYDKLNKQLYFVGGEYDASRHEGIVH